MTRWDKYWTIDSAGVCEFTGTKDAETAAINEHVLKTFEQTIEKRSDGFARVPFGLNVSPFLLAGTVNHHLRTQEDGKAIAKEIRENLYVDNLILAANSVSAIAQKAKQARTIFESMGMNLREFLSNTDAVHQNLPTDACAKGPQQRVLGMMWNAHNDELTVSCSLPAPALVTKRVVARQIASVYDPFGWVTPLITQAKHFQQRLRKERYSWDEILPVHLHDEWNNICQSVDGFHRIIPRTFVKGKQL
ncbi:hypothetical protein OESDEN_17935 [Oesophagostomum dentatum]|uniref:Reverse transcriptase domain-containing protein n=1 Tax=Oesophagostomum dentatum TaxID=61180 RepID=A0A0B1SEP3_OESDE|nr:hypothetical protein OESDEN_17935 [Oesophagostomum dentatum]